MKNIFLITTSILLAIIIQSCASKEDQAAEQPMIQKVVLPTVLEKGLKAHGGLELWRKMKAMDFSFSRGPEIEHQKIALDNRKALITRDSVQVGYDGKEVWVAPNKAAFGKSSARFYHNLIFYFYAMPFVLADDGIIYEEVPNRVLDGKSYPGVKVSYKSGVGDAPDDYYIAYFHPETKELYLLLYTVTYYNGGPSDKYNALVYESWQDVFGLKLPLKMAGYKFVDNELGDKRYEREFTEVKLSSEAFDESIFNMPKIAEIDSLIQH